MRKSIITLLITSCLLLTGVTHADRAQMRATMVKIVNRLQAIKPLINKAKREQPEHSRVKIHFDQWRNQKGQMQNGVLQDVEAIQHSLVHAIRQQRVQPRYYQPIHGDFIDKNTA